MEATTMEDFIKNHDILREDYRIDGLIEFEAVDMEKRLASYGRSCVVALVGPYGSGKSTALNKARISDTTGKWLQFDAWRYPERKGLWDGLVIEIAKQLGQDKKALRKLDGHKSVIGKWGTPLAEIFSQIADVIPEDSLNWLGGLTKASGSDSLKGAAKVGASTTKIGEKVAGLFEKSPAKRAYEVERILADLLATVSGDKICIVVEDVDRSGSDGINFLETLSFFISNTPELEDKQIIIIAPLSDLSYAQNMDSYLKCVDYFEFYEPRIKNIDKFLTEIFLPSAMSPKEGVIKDFLEGLFREYPKDMTARKLKLILRQTSNAYLLQRADKFDPDWRVTLCFQAARYIHDTSQTGQNYLDRFRQDRRISSGMLFGKYLFALITSNNRLYADSHDEDAMKPTRKLRDIGENFKLVLANGGKLPWNDLGWKSETMEYYVPDYYLEY